FPPSSPLSHTHAHTYTLSHTHTHTRLQTQTCSSSQSAVPPTHSMSNAAARAGDSEFDTWISSVCVCLLQPLLSTHMLKGKWLAVWGVGGVRGQQWWERERGRERLWERIHKFSPSH